MPPDRLAMLASGDDLHSGRRLEAEEGLVDLGSDAS
jgi:hypothetical protein